MPLRFTVSSSFVITALAATFGCSAGNPDMDGETSADQVPSPEGVASVDDIRFANAYLSSFGYLPNAELSKRLPGFQPVVARAPAAETAFDASSERALRAFQLNMNLPATGALDAETLAVMAQPRCGNPDHDPSQDGRKSKWSLMNLGTWTNPDVKYRFVQPNVGLGSLSATQSKAAIRRGLKAWEAATDLTFTEVSSGANFEIEYVAMDGPGRAGADAGPPPFQGMRFDTAEPWTESMIETVTLHEAGHLLGIDHSSTGGGFFTLPVVMWPAWTGRATLDDEDAFVGSSLYNGWERLPGSGTDIAVGGSTVWSLGRNILADGYRAYKLGPNGWMERPGARGMRIDADGAGRAWMVGRNSAVYREFDETSWQRIHGVAATDIGVSSNGAVFVTGTDGLVYSYNSSSSTWIGHGGPGNAVAIDVDPAGTPWIARSNEELWYKSGTSWFRQMNMAARDVALGGIADGLTFRTYRVVIGNDDTPYAHALQSSVQPCPTASPCPTPAVDQWLNIQHTSAVRISIGRRGRMHIVDSAGRMYRRAEVAN